ncbi:Tetratricopeptide repeat superfamily protein [Perilla frutescens var. hirtella]|nr:Tetratricopeptide repeat superfamily protein [Perilla frutescens var. hirtella]
MGLKVAPASLHWSQPSVPQSPPSCSQTLASAISSPSSRRRSFVSGDGALFCRFVEKSGLFLGANQPSNLYRSRSCGNKRSRVRIIRKALSASLDSFFDEEISKKIQELAVRCQLSEDDDDGSAKMNETFETRLDNAGASAASNGEAKFLENSRPFEALEPPHFPDRDEIIPANIERKANSVDIPLSLRIIKRKKQWQGGVVEARESAYCSMKKAFSSMVFIIRELHSYTLQMRSILFYEDLQGIVANVQKEIHASFVWLFQTVFSQTPTLMVYVMILLANYSVYSMSSNAALAAAPPLQPYAATTEEVSSMVDDESYSGQKFDSSIVKTLKLSSSSGKTASVGGNNGGGGGKFRSVASGTEGDGRFDESNSYSTISTDGASSLLNPSRTSDEESVSRQVSMEEEAALWNSIVEEASKMQAPSRDGVLDQETMKRFVSPVDARIEDDDQSEYFRMELLYQTGLAQEPNNPLLLANYAQFLYLVVRDLDRAEDYFKRATKVEPKDAEALNKYATFLWLVRNDLWAAEETYLEAIDAEPSNSYYAANYAHFLWNTGGEDTCFPLSSPDAESDGV